MAAGSVAASARLALRGCFSNTVGPRSRSRFVAAPGRQSVNSTASRPFSRSTCWRNDKPEDDQQGGAESSTLTATNSVDPPPSSGLQTDASSTAFTDSSPPSTFPSPSSSLSESSSAGSDTEPASLIQPTLKKKILYPPEIALLAPELQAIFPLIPKAERGILLNEAQKHLRTLPDEEKAKLAAQSDRLSDILVSRFGPTAANPDTLIEPSTQSTALMSSFLAHIKPERTQGLFSLDETDGDIIGNDEKFENDDISPTAHAELERQREIREYARWTVWELPLLSKFAKPYSPPARSEILRFCYTRVLGDPHPSDRKVVMEFCVADLESLLPEKAQRDKLIKLVGARYNPDTDLVRMSSDSYETSTQNKRRLAIVFQRLLDEVRNSSADSFADLPMDFRHHKSKPTKASFPTDWIITPERRKELDSKWAQMND